MQSGHLNSAVKGLESFCSPRIPRTQSERTVSLHRPSFPWCFSLLGVFLAGDFLGRSGCALLVCRAFKGSENQARLACSQVTADGTRNCFRSPHERNDPRTKRYLYRALACKTHSLCACEVLNNSKWPKEHSSMISGV